MRVNFQIFSWGHTPDPLTRECLVWFTHCQPPTLNSAALITLIICVHERPNLKFKPATHLDTLLDQCLV